jgi:Phage integrase, N-terminal SAM-like domain
MKAGSPNTLARALRGFFADHLPRVRGTSPHTIHSYRDTFVLLLRFLADRGRRSVADLDVEDLGPQDVLEFLHHLEVEHCQRVLAVPFKRARSRAVEYLDFPEIQAVLAAIDRSTVGGRRDYALLVTMFNTGARVQEIVTLRVADLRLASPPHLRLFGKGRKERLSHCGRRRSSSCVRSSPNATAHRKVTSHCFSITVVDPSRDSACAISWRSTAHRHARRCRRWPRSGCIRTTCATARPSICSEPASTSSRSVNGSATPASPRRTGTPPLISR